MEIKDILDYVTWAPRNNNINVLKAMLETLVEEYSISDIGSVGVEDIIEYVELTPHNSNVNVLRIMLESLINPEPVIEGEAYAVFDSANGSLVFFRDEPGKYSEGQVEDTKTYYTGVEEDNNNWIVKNQDVINVRFDDVIKPIRTTAWFSECGNTTSIIGLDKLDTSKVTDMSNMFNNCSSLVSLDVSGFDTSKVTDMRNMFNNCVNLTSLDVSGFDTSNVIDMSWMFHECTHLPIVNISGFDMSNVTNMSYMFNNCTSLTTDITINDILKYPVNMFIGAAIDSPAKITLYGEGDVTSADIDTLIASVKAESPDSNIVNGMLSSNVVFDEDVVLDFEGSDPPQSYVSLTPLIPIEDTSIPDSKYIIRITNPQMRKYLGGDPMYGEWLDAICTANQFITSADNRFVLSTYIVRSDAYGGWAIEFNDESGEGYVPTKFHLRVEKIDQYPYTIATIGAFETGSFRRPDELTISQNPKNNWEIGTATFRNFYEPEHGNVDECDTTVYLSLREDKYRLSTGIPFTEHETEEEETDYYYFYIEFPPEDISNLDFWVTDMISNSFSWDSVEITMEREM